MILFDIILMFRTCLKSEDDLWGYLLESQLLSSLQHMFDQKKLCGWHEGLVGNIDGNVQFLISFVKQPTFGSIRLTPCDKDKQK